ncbi:hypothetical protein SAMN05444172_2568 [Burkholderia sp. GAS332]|nr:hypothetical protein SAMN05444172_2568 [Burkholderia sp. GAS332]
MIGVGLSIGRRRYAGGPTLDLDFLTHPVLPPAFTFKRASNATYFGTDGLMQTAAPSVARFDCEPSTRQQRGQLIEGPRTNYLTNSAAAEKWTLYGVSATANGPPGPDGITPSRRVTENLSSTTVHAISQAPALALASVNAVSYASRLHAAERTEVRLMLANGGTTAYCGATFDLVGGVVTAKSANVGEWTLVASSIVPLGGGWWECRIVGSVTSAVSVRGSTYLSVDGDYNYPGDGASGLYHASSQLELYGFPTSYIPTTTASASRAADLMNSSDLTWYNREEGTLLVDAAMVGVYGGGWFAVSLDNGVNNGIGIYKTNGTGAMNAFSGGSAPLGVILTDAQRFRAAVAYSNGGASAVASINGRPPIVIGTAAAVVPTQFSIGSSQNGSFGASMWARAVRYWPTRMEGAALSDLTRLN